PLPGAVGMTSPRIRTRKSPSCPRRAVPRVRTQGAPPALAPFSTGSLGTLGASDVLSNASPRWRPWSPVLWPAALTAVVAEPAITATDSTATALPVDKRIFLPPRGIAWLSKRCRAPRLLYLRRRRGRTILPIRGPRRPQPTRASVASVVAPPREDAVSEQRHERSD